MTQTIITITLPELSALQSADAMNAIRTALSRVTLPACNLDEAISTRASKTAYKLYVEMEYGDGEGTRLDYLLFATREEMEAARIELENDIFDHSDITVFESSPAEVVLGKGDELHSGPLTDVEFVQEMRDYLGLDEED